MTASSPPTATAKLYSPTAILFSTIVFTPLVGGAMAAINWRRVGDAKKARNTLLLAGGAIVAMLAISILVPDSMGSLQRGGVIGGTMGAAMAFRNEQRPLFEAHVAAGGAKASPLVPILVGAAFVGIVLAALFAASASVPAT